MTKAVEEDEKLNYTEAYHLYCEGLQHFVPIIIAENDLTKRIQLQGRAMNYLERAEEIKSSYKQANARYEEAEGSVATTSNTAIQPSIESALNPSAAFNQLCTFEFLT